jgi:hypothetical protein
LPKRASNSRIRASLFLFSPELKSWSTKSSSYRMFRDSKYPTNMSENACFRWSTSFIDFFSIFITEQSVIALAEHRRRGRPVRQPLRKNRPCSECLLWLPSPTCDTTVSFTLPSFYLKDSVGRVALSKDRLSKGNNPFQLADFACPSRLFCGGSRSCCSKGSSLRVIGTPRLPRGNKGTIGNEQHTSRMPRL